MEQLEDRALLATLSIGPSGLHVAEGGTATLQVSISPPQMQPTSFTFRTVSGTAIGGTDYEEISSGNGTIMPGSSFTSLSFQALNDFFLEGQETFSVELLDASGATLDPAASSTAVTIDNVQSGGSSGSGGSLTASLSLPTDVNEGETFTLTGTINAGGYYYVTGAINWGTTSGEGTTSFAVYTNPDGTFSVPHRYLDDGPDPGNGTDHDLESITITGTATPIMPGGETLTVTGSTSTTIHNVAPAPVFDIYNYMPIGGPQWVVSCAYQDVGLTDKATITVDWGDNTEPLVFANVETGFSFDTNSNPHRYPADGRTYPITITVTDDDTGSVSFSKPAPLYLFDLDNDANNNGEIAASDEPYEPVTPNEYPAGPHIAGPGRYISVNADDDNEDGIADMDQVGPISGENDLEAFEIHWRGDMRPDIQNYAGWHLALKVPHQSPDWAFLNPRIWFNPDKSPGPPALDPDGNGQLDLDELDAQFAGKDWTIGDVEDPIPEILYLEARQTDGIVLQLRLWTPNGELVETDTIAFNAIPADLEVNMEIYDGQYKDGDKPISNADEDKTGAVTVANKNDTDADDKKDFEDDNGVIETRMGDEAHGRNEVDLMPLVIYRPKMYTDGDVVLTVIAKKENVKMWTTSKKQTPLSEYDAATGKATFNPWPATVKSKTVWLELIETSTEVGDVKLKLTYKEYIPDEVWATGVWSELSVYESDTKEWDKGPVEKRLGPPWTTEMDKSLQDRVKLRGGTGVRPDPVPMGGAAIHFPNVILFQFTIFPAGVTDKLARVKFDATRQNVGRMYITLADGTIEIYQPMDEAFNPNFPIEFERPNDDKHDKDESDKPINNHFYSTDAPGPLANDPPLAGEPDRIHQKDNFVEFMRVGFKGRPTGNSIAGSRSSEEVRWHSWTTIDRATGKWKRFGGDAANNIGLKQIEIGDQP